MNYNTFITSIKSGFPTDELTNPELAMWHAMNDNWNIAHLTSQSIKNELGASIYAYLHQIEGDLHWYRRANRPPFHKIPCRMRLKKLFVILIKYN